MSLSFRYLFVEEFGKWRTGDLLLGLAYLSRREQNQHTLRHIAQKGTVVGLDYSDASRTAILVCTCAAECGALRWCTCGSSACPALAACAEYMCARIHDWLPSSPVPSTNMYVLHADPGRACPLNASALSTH